MQSGWCVNSTRHEIKFFLSLKYYCKRVKTISFSEVEKDN